MQGMEKTTVQDYVNQARESGDAPALNRGAPGAQAVRAPQDYVSLTIAKRGDEA